MSEVVVSLIALTFFALVFLGSVYMLISALMESDASPLFAIIVAPLAMLAGVGSGALFIMTLFRLAGA